MICATIANGLWSTVDASPTASPVCASARSATTSPNAPVVGMEVKANRSKRSPSTATFPADAVNCPEPKFPTIPLSPGKVRNVLSVLLLGGRATDEVPMMFPFWSQSVTATVAVTLWDQNGNIIGTSSVALPPSSKTESTLRTLPGLSGMVGNLGSGQFTASAGNVAVLGLRFDRLAFTSIPTTGALGDVVAERALAQTGLAVGLASTVLQSQFAMFAQIIQKSTNCAALTGGGSTRWAGGGNVATYYDAQCTQLYVATNPGTTVTTSGNKMIAAETATYYAPK